jgi:YegS/Rv2252/BmrU family lipid kinase
MIEENNKWLVVVNPKASIGKCGKDWPDIQNIMLKKGIAFDAFLTEYPRHAIEIARNNITEKGYKKIISIGGDGTNNEVINGIFTQNRFPTKEITMGVIPVGTGNDWRRTFDFPIDYQINANIIKNGFTILHDIGKVTYYNDGNPQERYFLNAAGTGLNEMVCNRTNQLKSQGKGGAVRYMLSTANCLFQFKCVHIKLEIDGQEVFDDEILSLSVGNGKFNGGGMMMMPFAIPNDGLFDITVVKKVGMLKFASNISNIYDGTFIDKLSEVSTYRGKKIRVTSIPAHQLLLETEGETLTNSPFDFEIIPKAINMVVPWG